MIKRPIKKLISMLLCISLMLGTVDLISDIEINAFETINHRTVNTVDNDDIFHTDDSEADTDVSCVGDVDGDGKITPKDVTKLRRFLAGGWGVNVEVADGDVDEDGSITPKDVTKLRRYLAGGWGVILPEKKDESGLQYQILHKRDIVRLGKYEQDNNLENGKEAIEWIVLCAYDGEATLISRYVLDNVKFNKIRDGVTWAGSDIRRWLNEDFYEAAFDKDEKELIHDISLSDEVSDKVSLMNAGEIMNPYFWFSAIPTDSDLMRRCSPTDYAIAQGVDAYPYALDCEGRDACVWWLYTGAGNKANAVTNQGLVLLANEAKGREYDDYGIGVRPMIKVSCNPFLDLDPSQEMTEEEWLECYNTKVQKLKIDNEDGSVTIRENNRNEKLLEEYTEGSDGNWERKTYSYDSIGRVLSVKEEAADEGYTLTEYWYDDVNFPGSSTPEQTKKEYYRNNKLIHTYFKKSYNYEVDTRYNRFGEVSLDKVDGTYLGEPNTTYNVYLFCSDGYIVKKLIYNKGNSREYYDYDKKGRAVNSSSFLSYGWGDMKADLEYIDESGVEIKVVLDSLDRPKYEIKSKGDSVFRLEYTYDGDCLSRVVCFGLDGDGYVEDYQYNDDRLLIKKIHTDVDVTKDFYIDYIYEGGKVVERKGDFDSLPAETENVDDGSGELEQGDIIVFGSYEQDNNLTNGKEPIEWIVLAVKKDRVFLLSRYALDCQFYNDIDVRKDDDETNDDITWEQCTLRQWLNSDFYYKAFSDRERTIIREATIANNGSPEYGRGLCHDTKDRIFLLSYDDVQNEDYGFVSEETEWDAKRRCTPTAYVVSKMENQNQNYYLSPYRCEENMGTCIWWLRTRGESYDSFYVVDRNGWLSGWCHHNLAVVPVRPAMYINLDSLQNGDNYTIVYHNYDYGEECPVKLGDSLTVGEYEQDNDLSNGMEPIDWTVIGINGGRALLLSRYVLDSKSYSEEQGEVTWAESDLRKWMNGDFYNNSFDTWEKGIICSEVHKNLMNPETGAHGGNDTEDKVFVLSHEELDLYFEGIKNILTGEPTAYAFSQGLNYESNDSYYSCLWWLRSVTGYPEIGNDAMSSEYRAAVVGSWGSVSFDSWGCNVDENSGVRPAIWIDINSFLESKQCK